MGQCYVRLKAAARRRLAKGGRQYRHKRFDYAPQRSWYITTYIDTRRTTDACGGVCVIPRLWRRRRYNDAQVMNQISLRGTEYDSPVWELEERGERVGRGGGGRERVLLNPMIEDDSEGEEEAGEIRR